MLKKYISWEYSTFTLSFVDENVQIIDFLSTIMNKSIFLIGFHDEFTRRTQNVTILKIRIQQRGDSNYGIL